MPSPLPSPRLSATARYADDVSLAHVLADTADSIALQRFRAQDLRISTKPDDTPVTDADVAIEEAMRSVLARARPRDAMLGEETGLTTGAAGHERRWIIDPIDGTKNFLRGVPIWGTLIGLMEGDNYVAGLVSAPALGRRWWAAAGSGAFAGKHQTAATPISVSKVYNLGDASVSYASLHSWSEGGRFDNFLQLTRQAWRTRAYGDFYGYVLMAEGAVDVTLEPELRIWDTAALIPIVTEAGGQLTNLAGAPFRDRDSAVATNGLLHEDTLARMSLA